MFKKILVPTDGSQNAMKAVNKAVELVKSLPEAEVAIIYVYPPRSVAHAMWVSEEAYQEAFEREAKKTSAEATAAFAEAGIQVQTLFRSGDAGTEIVKCAEEEGFDLIVMGTRGAAGFSAWIVGSVAQKVVSRAPCPVLLIR